MLVASGAGALACYEHGALVGVRQAKAAVMPALDAALEAIERAHAEAGLAMSIVEARAILAGEMSRKSVRRLAPPVARSSAAEQKREVFSRLMAAGGPVQVHLVPSAPGVVVPAGVAGADRLILDFWNPRGARDTEWDAEGLSETLSFGCERVRVTIPWGVIFLMRQLDGEGLIATFDDVVVSDGPGEVSAPKMEEIAESTPSREPARPPIVRRGHLRLVRLVRNGD